MTPKIFVFCNTRNCEGTDWHSMVALAEDGTGLAGHVCSSHAYAAHDMGIDPEGLKRDLYAAHYPDGFEVEWVESALDPRIDAALSKRSAAPGEVSP